MSEKHVAEGDSSMMRCPGLVLAVVLGMLAAFAEAAAPPGKTRELTADEQKEVTALEARAVLHAKAGEFEQVTKVRQEIADYRQTRQGARHWQAVDARYVVENWQRLVKVPAQDRAEVWRAWGLNSVGSRLLDRGRFREAEKPLRQALLVRERMLGKEHPATASSYHNLASCLNDQGKAAEALPLSRQALLIREKVLGKEHPDTADSYAGVATCLQAQGKAGEALPLYREALRIREKVLGKEHPDTATSYNNLAYCLKDQGKAAEALPLYREALRIREKVLGKEHPDTATSYNNVAVCLQARGKAAEALPLYRQALLINEKVLGKEHPSTATSYNSMAFCLNAQGKAAEALPFYRQALLIREKVLGKEHPYTAQSYNNLATCLGNLGKEAEALPLFRQALLLREKVLGSEHPSTAASYNNVANCLNGQGKSAEALPLFRQALLIRERVLGKEHPDTASSYNSVAACLTAQGKAAEALPLFRQALLLREKALGKEHPSTAVSYNNLASCLNAQGESTKALPLYRQALLIREKVLGKEHPDTAASYNSVASCLQDQGKAVGALPLYREALRIREKVLGKEHPDTAASYNNLAYCLQAQGKAAEALPLFRQTLLIWETVLGKEHPHTATSYNNVAQCLWELGRPNETVRLLQQSLRGQEVARVLRAESGFDRALYTQGISVQEALAVGLARLKQPRNAFRHAEASLARALLDDLSGLTTAEAARKAELRGRLTKLDPVLASFWGKSELGEQNQRYSEVKQEYGELRRELSDLYAIASARNVFPLERIQKSIPSDAALVLWMEFMGERWGCILRAESVPIWRPLVKAPVNKRVFSVYQALTDPISDDEQRQQLLSTFRKEYFDPLRPHLKGVTQLFVVPTGAMAFIPADLLAEDFAIRYVPSGSVLAHTVENHRAVNSASLLALGDPLFNKAPPSDPPATGVLVLRVLPNSFAAKVGLQPGDVLLSIGNTKLESIDDLTGARSSLPANADVWRDGKTFTVKLQGSPLGAVLDKRSARAAVRAWRREREAVAQRDTGHKRLPGTRLEVEAIAGMVKGSTTLLGSDASEQKLDDLIDSGKLKGYRIVHIATHGETNEQTPSRSSLILAQDSLPDPLAQVNANKHVYDGRLTVSRIRERWALDADLVVLSACETGLGKNAGGDGLLGFAQAFLSRGARSVILSRWKVDDTATSLLMIRLYENLLGKRKGVKPMGRAASLEEAKKWLRTLPRKEAERLATLHTGGVLRGSEGTEKTPDKVKKIEYKGDTPFAHPYYWAAWTLIGDPD